MLLRHFLGIPQAPLSSCSSQALQLVSVCRGGPQKGELGGPTPHPQAPSWDQRGMSQAAPPNSPTVSPRRAA